MRVQISKWGNSLGLRLPKTLARKIGVSAGQSVELVLDGERLIIEPTNPAQRLEDLLVNMTPGSMGEAFDWGEDAGREAVDE